MDFTLSEAAKALLGSVTPVEASQQDFELLTSTLEDLVQVQDAYSNSQDRISELQSEVAKYKDSYYSAKRAHDSLLKQKDELERDVSSLDLVKKDNAAKRDKILALTAKISKLQQEMDEMTKRLSSVEVTPEDLYQMMKAFCEGSKRVNLDVFKSTSPKVIQFQIATETKGDNAQPSHIVRMALVRVNQGKWKCIGIRSK